MGNYKVKNSYGNYIDVTVGGKEVSVTWEKGAINIANGLNSSRSNRLRTKNYIDVANGIIVKTSLKPPSEEETKKDQVLGVCPVFYDKNHKFISGGKWYLTEYSYKPSLSTKNIKYMRLMMKISQDNGSFVTTIEDGPANCIIKTSEDWNPFKNKKLIYIGDSIPHGQSTAGNVPVPYPQIVALHLGIKIDNNTEDVSKRKFINYAIGGSTIACKTNYGGFFINKNTFDAANKKTSKKYEYYKYKKSFQTAVSKIYDSGVWVDNTQALNEMTKDQWNYEGRTRTPICERIKYIESGADYIVIAAGTNDFQYNWTPLGTINSKSNNTFYGALNNICDFLINDYGINKKHIIFCTPIKRSQDPYKSLSSKNQYGKTLEEYGKCIKKVCEKKGVNCLDLYNLSGLDPIATPELFDGYRTHPLQTGHDRLGLIVAGQLEKLLKS